MERRGWWTGAILVGVGCLIGSSGGQVATGQSRGWNSCALLPLRTLPAMEADAVATHPILPTHTTPIPMGWTVAGVTPTGAVICR